MLYDVFICHATEDKNALVRPLTERLRNDHVEVWYDEFSLKLGDSIRQSIDKGLRQSRFGVIILSKAFFSKKWSQYELDGLTEIEMRGKDKVILPVWHDISADEIVKISPSLANRFAVTTSNGIDSIVKAILEVVHPEGSPLIEARDYLLELSIKPPVITDQYWLDVIEASNRVSSAGATVYEEQSWGRWSFPLPDKESGAKQWGEKLAWTAMQLAWTRAAEEIPITILTEPKEVLDYIDSFPGLFETCQTYPQYVAEYAPQLTIPGMGGKLETIFEELYQRSVQNNLKSKDSTSGAALTMNGTSPICDEMWVLRHPLFCNYEAVYIASDYFSGGIFGPPVSPYEHTEHVFWLLSSNANWLPEKIHQCLIEGMANWQVWIWHRYHKVGEEDWKNRGALSSALRDASEGKTEFKWTKKLEDDLLNRIALAIRRLSLHDSPEQIKDRFLKYKFPEQYLAESKRT